MLPLLDVAVKSNALPAIATCPLCHTESQLRVVLDAVTGGEWAYCLTCKFSGDMIALAARAWKLGIPATLRRLAER